MAGIIPFDLPSVRSSFNQNLPIDVLINTFGTPEDSFSRWVLKKFKPEVEKDQPYVWKKHIPDTDRTNVDNLIWVVYKNGQAGADSELQISSPLFAINQKVTVTCLNYMKKAMDAVRDPALVFNLDDYLKDAKTLKLFKEIFNDPKNQHLIDRLSKADRKILGIRDPAAKVDASLTAEVVGAQPLLTTTPPQSPPVASPSPPAVDPYSQRGSGEKYKHHAFLNDVEVKTLNSKVFEAESFHAVDDQELLGIYKKDAAGSSSPTIYAIAQPFTNKEISGQSFWKVLQANASLFQKPCKILGTMAVGENSKHYVAVCVEINEKKELSAKVADSLNGMYLAGKTEEAHDSEPKKDFDAIRAGLSELIKVNQGLTTFVVSDQELLCDNSLVFKQPDHISCGLYAARNMLGLAGIQPQGEIKALQSDTNQGILSQDVGNKDIQKNACDVLSKFHLDDVKGADMAKLWETRHQTTRAAAEAEAKAQAKAQDQDQETSSLGPS